MSRKHVVSLTWKTPSTPIEFRGEGDTELDAWADLHIAIAKFRAKTDSELEDLAVTAYRCAMRGR